MRILVIAAAATALVACGGPDVIENDSASAEALPRLNGNESSPTGGPPADANATAPASQTGSATIPRSLHGRWGLTPGDCTSSRGDAKGLLLVGAGSLQFYESRAVPADKVQTSQDSISGNFNFTGEGQSWSRHTTLEIREDKMIRTERDPIESFTYVRC